MVITRSAFLQASGYNMSDISQIQLQIYILFVQGPKPNITKKPLHPPTLNRYQTLKKILTISLRNI